MILLQRTAPAGGRPLFMRSGTIRGASVPVQSFIRCCKRAFPPRDSSGIYVTADESWGLYVNIYDDIRKQQNSLGSSWVDRIHSAGKKKCML